MSRDDFAKYLEACMHPAPPDVKAELLGAKRMLFGVPVSAMEREHVCPKSAYVRSLGRRQVIGFEADGTTPNAARRRRRRRQVLRRRALRRAGGPRALAGARRVLSAGRLRRGVLRGGPAVPSRDGHGPPRRPLRGRVRPHQWRRRSAVAAPPQAAAATAAGASSAAPAATASSGCPATASSAAAAVAAAGSGASASSAAQTAQAGRKVSFWFFNKTTRQHIGYTTIRHRRARSPSRRRQVARLPPLPPDVLETRVEEDGLLGSLLRRLWPPREQFGHLAR